MLQNNESNNLVFDPYRLISIFCKNNHSGYASDIPEPIRSMALAVTVSGIVCNGGIDFLFEKGVLGISNYGEIPDAFENAEMHDRAIALRELFDSIGALTWDVNRSNLALYQASLATLDGSLRTAQIHRVESLFFKKSPDLKKSLGKCIEINRERINDLLKSMGLLYE
jgi:hypothetical protein